MTHTSTTVATDETKTAAVVAESKICLALEGLSLERACSLTSKLGMYCYAVKIHDLHDAEGPNAIRVLKKVGAKRVWVDAKLHDTPDTVALRMRALTRNGADIITVHASGGIKMMEAAAAAALYAGGDILTEIWAITLLTSLGPTEIERDFGKYGRNPTAEQIVLNRALMAREGGLNGLVCSAKEVGMLSSHHDLQGMTFTVPGTRSAGVALGQQKRSGTPAQAISDGATFIVASSQVVKAEHPVMAFKAMAAEVGMQI